MSAHLFCQQHKHGVCDMSFLACEYTASSLCASIIMFAAETETTAQNLQLHLNGFLDKNGPKKQKTKSLQ